MKSKNHIVTNRFRNDGSAESERLLLNNHRRKGHWQGWNNFLGIAKEHDVNLQPNLDRLV